ncbi:hypothetical protein GCM10007301_54990 [Azorhizobium oxalatiphilum]|uniref:DUF721 domain-containing protein n=1 Tax=Azorhizobium oxalatiphilum TaxID=980631 RepID=A0A917CG71_9HYPH|nr:hypothetical protein GCM10007301_54990 [Azorhizobium oxalatiphilum]
MRPLADLIGPSIADALGRAGFSVVEIVTHWDDIVGPDLAPRTLPLKMQWPNRQNNEPATLVVRVEGPYAIELQYAAPVVVERINAYFGWRCVGRLALRQGPVPPRIGPPPKPVEPSAAELADIRHDLKLTEDDALSASLARLGALVRRERRGR